MAHIKYTMVCSRIIFIHKVKWITYMLLWNSVPHFFKRWKHTIQLLLKLAARVTFLNAVIAIITYIDMEHMNALFLHGKRTFQTVCTLWPHLKIFLSFSLCLFTIESIHKSGRICTKLNLKYFFFLGSGIRVIFIFISFFLVIYIFWQRTLLCSGFFKSYI